MASVALLQTLPPFPCFLEDDGPYGIETNSAVRLQSWRSDHMNNTDIANDI